MLLRPKKPPTPEPPPHRSERRPDGRLVYVVGFTGSGKTTWVRQEVRADRRLLVWDGKEEWGERDRCRVVTSPHELRELVLARKASRISYRVPITRANFEVFCKLAWVWCRFDIGALIVEELSDVTTPGKAPVAWGEIIRKSRAYGTEIYTLTQRPQEVDKTAQGNAAVFHVGMMPDEVDQNYVARRLLGVPVAMVAALKPLHYIERDTRTHVVRSGVVKLRK